MSYDPNKHHRRSIRLQAYDYAQAGAYFVTICTQDRVCILGEVVENRVELSTLGCVVDEAWHQTPDIRPQVTLDAYVIMPNHVHMIFWIVDSDVGDNRTPDAGAYGNTPLPTQPRPNSGEFRSSSQTVGAILRGFKATTTQRINRIRQTPSVRVWQRNYYERIIRDEDELNAIRRYIADNPSRWADDADNPATWPDDQKPPSAQNP